jgi:hypothetical protein
MAAKCIVNLTIWVRRPEIKLGQCEIQPLRLNIGQHHPTQGNRLATPEPFLNSADADRTSVQGQTEKNSA